MNIKLPLPALFTPRTRQLPPHFKRRRRSSLWLPLAILSLWLAGCASGAPFGATPTPDRPARIAFMSDRDGNFEIYLMARDGSDLANLTNNEAQDGLPAWSQGADAFAFLTSRESEDSLALYRMDVNGENPQEIDIGELAIGGIFHWSPDGKQLAFEAGDEVESDIYVLDIASAEIRNLTDNAGPDRFGSWSPNGESILFTTLRDGNIVIYAVSLADGETSRLTDPAWNSASPDWSPDGKQIAYFSDQDEDIDIYVMDANGENGIRLTTSEGFDGYPRWSPDGKQIAFISNRDGNPEIYVMNLDGSEPTNLTNTPEAQEGVQGDYSWSPDGQQILFHSDRSGDVEVYVMDADGGNVTNLTNNPANDLASIWVP